MRLYIKFKVKLTDYWTLNGMNTKYIDRFKIFIFCFWKKIKIYIKFKVKLTFFYNIHTTAFLNMLKSNVQKSLKINIQWTKKRGVKVSVFERSKLTVHIVHYERFMNAIYTLIFLLGPNGLWRVKMIARTSALKESFILLSCNLNAFRHQILVASSVIKILKAKQICLG